MKELWIHGLNYTEHRFGQFYFSVYSLAFVSTEPLETKTSNFVKNTPLRFVFSSLFLVLRYHYETLSLVFDRPFA